MTGGEGSGGRSVPLTSAAPFDPLITGDRRLFRHRSAVSMVTTIHHLRDAAEDQDLCLSLPHLVFLTWSSLGFHPWIVVVIPPTTTGRPSAVIQTFKRLKEEKKKKRNSRTPLSCCRFPLLVPDLHQWNQSKFPVS